MLKNIPLLMVFPAVIVLFSGTSAFAQADFNGEVTISYLNLDDEGNRSAARELYDTYDGIDLQNLTAFGNINPHTRYYLRFDDVNLDGRRAVLNITDINLFKLKASYRQSRHLFGPGEDRKNDRKTYSGYFEISPIKTVAGYFEYRGLSNEGDRVVFDVADQGLFGRLYDRNSTLIKGGAKIRYEGHQLDISYGKRKYEDSINEELDSKTDFINLNIYGRIHPKIKIVSKFSNARKEKELSGDKLDENLISLAVLSRPVSALTLSPIVSYRTVSSEPNDYDFSATRVGLKADYSTPYDAVLSGKLGYESRKARDSTSNLLYYSVGARYRYSEKIAVKAYYSGQNRNDPDDATITGVEDRTRIKTELDLTPCSQGNIKAGYKISRRENSDIDTKSETGTFYAALQRRFRDLADCSLQLNRSDVEFTWGEESLKYKYNSWSGALRLFPREGLVLSAGGTFFIYDDDVQQDKLDMTFGASYQFTPRARLGVSYRRYELDGYNRSPAYYEANLVKGELTFNFGK